LFLGGEEMRICATIVLAHELNVPPGRFLPVCSYL
jgi:hypothetical protein